jgi:hypothetical protein
VDDQASCLCLSVSEHSCSAPQSSEPPDWPTYPQDHAGECSASRCSATSMRCCGATPYTSLYAIARRRFRLMDSCFLRRSSSFRFRSSILLPASLPCSPANHCGLSRSRRLPVVPPMPVAPPARACVLSLFPYIETRTAGSVQNGREATGLRGEHPHPFFAHFGSRMSLYRMRANSGSGGNGHEPQHLRAFRRLGPRPPGGDAGPPVGCSPMARFRRQ